MKRRWASSLEGSRFPREWHPFSKDLPKNACAYLHRAFHLRSSIHTGPSTAPQKSANASQETDRLRRSTQRILFILVLTTCGLRQKECHALLCMANAGRTDFTSITPSRCIYHRMHPVRIQVRCLSLLGMIDRPNQTTTSLVTSCRSVVPTLFLRKEIRVGVAAGRCITDSGVFILKLPLGVSASLAYELSNAKKAERANDVRDV